MTSTYLPNTTETAAEQTTDTPIFEQVVAEHGHDPTEQPDQDTEEVAAP